MSRVWIAAFALMAACGGGSSTSGGTGSGGTGGGGGDTGGGGDNGGGGGGGQTADDPNAQYAALEAGADYASLNKMNTELFFSKTHGKRMVDVYVNDLALEPYKDPKKEMAFPVGSVIVKTSLETGPDKVPTDVPGPIFVMVKKEAGFDPANEDWWYALHWEKVPEKWQKVMGGEQVYWRSPSSKVNYCFKCHKNFPRHLGGVPKKVRAWEKAE